MNIQLTSKVKSTESYCLTAKIDLQYIKFNDEVCAMDVAKASKYGSSSLVFSTDSNFTSAIQKIEDCVSKDYSVNRKVKRDTPFVFLRLTHHVKHTMVRRLYH